MLVYCKVCDKPMEVKPSRVKRSKVLTCSIKCRSEYMKEAMTGVNNPNYGKKWSDSKRVKQSKLISSKVTEEYRVKCSRGRSGKNFTFSDEHKQNMSISAKNKPAMSNETKLKISQASKAKFTLEFNERHRKTMEERGHWVPKELISDYRLYYRYAEWDDITQYSDSIGYDEYLAVGLYSGKTGNLDGLVRDHIYSRHDGYINGVFPEILKHPINLQFIGNVENIKKRHDSWIKLTELFDKIFKYKGDYVNHDRVINLIGEYTNGKRYKRR